MADRAGRSAGAGGPVCGGADPCARDRGTREALAWLLPVAGRRGVGLVACLCLLQAACAVLAVCLAPIMQQAVDAAVSGDARRFWLDAAAFAAVIAVQLALRCYLRRQTELARATLDNRLRARAFADVLALPSNVAERRHSAELMSRMTSDVQVVTDGVATLAPNVISMVIRLVGVLVVMYVIAPGLALAFVAVGAVCVAVSSLLRRELKRRHAAVQEAESRMRCFIQDCLESLLVVHAFGVEGKMRAANDANMGEHLRQRMRRNALANLGNTGFSAVVQGGYVAGFIWCGAGILAGTLTYGTLVAVIQLVGQIQAPIAGLGGTFSRWASTLASVDRLMDVGRDAGDAGAAGAGSVALRASFDVVGAAGPAGAPAASVPGAVPRTAQELYDGLERVRFDAVSFRYDADKPALTGVDAVLEKGTFTAVAGPSGVGKSTLMKLLLAAYLPDGGRVLLEGRSPQGARGAKGAAWAVDAADAPSGLFAYVPQGNRLMAGTLLEAVAFAERGPEPDEARAREACRVACADAFVRELPDGLATRLGERGAGLSEGQMQRIAVARAVYSAAPILLLDEATSALDAATEREMIENLRALPGRTVIIVTHREEVMDLCDQVLYMEEGAASLRPRG